MWDDARAYDLATGQFASDIEYWRGILTEFKPRRVLELACGTGRITLPIIETGASLHADFNLIGLDFSASFLRRATDKGITAGVGDRVRWVEGDMRTFAFDESFDLIILGFNSLAVLNTIDDHLGLLSSVRRHLAPGGHFAIDIQTPYLSLLAESRSAIFPIVRRELDWPHPAPGITRFSSFYVTSRYDAATQTEHTTHYWELYHEDGQRETHIKDLTWHHYFPHEVHLLLRQSGLTPIAQYGSYDRAPFDETSAQYLWVMKAASEAVP
jgi:ubiquinone/menaquinone biosynthesis C-methylase UbiE